jgi:MFS transporter, putative metabolite:H+ symporter
MRVTAESEPVPWPAIFVAAVGYFVDLFDTFLLPALRLPSLQDLGVPDADSLRQYTIIMNWQLAGMALGALFLWGPFADGRGRRRILFGSIIVYSLANLLTAAVQDTFQYAAIRFIAGIGLGGELGAGVTLVSENMKRDQRGVGTMIIGFFGMLGVVAAALLAKTSLHWRTDYLIGGLLGFGVLLLRLGVGESALFEKNRAANQRPSYFAILRFLAVWPHNKKFAACVLVGAPTFFVVGLLIPGAPEFGRAFGMKQLPSPSTALIWMYLSVALGDIACGALSQWIRSRKKAILIFHGFSIFALAGFLFLPPLTPNGFYLRCVIAGFCGGYWANMVINAAEQFGTNVRATVTITVPNFVRFLLFPISSAFLALKPFTGIVSAAAIVGVTCSLIAIAALLTLEDGFNRNLDYNEPLSPQPTPRPQPEPLLK